MTEDLAYRLGFLCIERSLPAQVPDAVSGWHRLTLGHADLYVHPSSYVQSIETARGEKLIAVGDVFVAHGARPLDDHLLDIASGARESLEDLSGRFALLTLSAEKISVMHDPLGSQSVFYSVAGGLVGSHAALLAETLGTPRSRAVRRYMALPEYKARTTRFLPGDLTMFDGVLLLAPNNELDLHRGLTTRYWPLSSIQDTNASEALAVWDEYFTKYADFLSSRYNPVIGLTGGTDSRSVIATLRSKGVSMRCETWDSMQPPERARIMPIVSHLGVQHRWLDLTHRSEAPRFLAMRSAAQKAAGYTRGTPLLPALVDEAAAEKDIFLYGHGSGVMRGSYSRLFKSWLPEDALKRLYALYAGPQRKKASREYEKFTLNALSGFLDRANYDSELFGADIGDLFYWEQRMANWGALQIATFAVTIQSHAAFNSRRLFVAFWGIDGEARSAKLLNMEFMRHYDSTLAQL
ncbi:hypothetical protein ACTXO9_18120 [Brachybacterium tyrofermentans]|uniref:hypothetical protein n=1 Tax=Brachybacterium tyrofermentans TaxID=47848 RepID=UPI003FD2EC31